MRSPVPEPDVVVACPSLALDRTLLVGTLTPGEIHRPLRVDVRGGGKGGNVARVLATLGATVELVGIVGPPGDPVTEALLVSLRRPGLRVQAVPGCATRTCTTIVAQAPPQLTAFYEPAGPCGARAWAAFAAAVVAAARGAAVAVLTGSLPPDIGPEQVRELADATMGTGAPLVCDLTGAALAAVLGARPALVTPNAAEAAAALGLPPAPAGLDRAVDLARRLLAGGAQAAVVSAGADGLAVASAAGGDRWTARMPARAVPVCNPTGAGDVLTAVLADGMRAGRPLTDSAERALGLATVSCTTFAAADLPARAPDMPPQSEVPAWQQ